MATIEIDEAQECRWRNDGHMCNRFLEDEKGYAVVSRRLAIQKECANCLAGQRNDILSEKNDLLSEMIGKRKDHHRQ